MPSLHLSLDQPWILLGIAALAFAAGFVRGFTGFGGPAIMIVVLTYFYAPASVLAKVLVMDTTANLQLVRGTWRQADWRRTRLLLVTTLIGTPLGVWALAQVDASVMQRVIAVLALASAAVLLSGWRMRREPPSWVVGTVGVVAGAAMTATGIALVMMVFLFSLPGTAATSRANAVQWLVVITALVMAEYVWAGLLTFDDAWRALLMGLVYLGGTILGASLFRASNDASVRRAAVWLLFGLALLGVAL